MTDEYPTTTDEIRAAYFVSKTGLHVSAMSHYPEFDLWLSEVERAAAEKAWDECKTAEDTAWSHVFNGHPVPEGEICDECPTDNPYRKAVQS